MRSDLGFAKANPASRNGELQRDCRLHKAKKTVLNRHSAPRCKNNILKG